MIAADRFWRRAPGDSRTAMRVELVPIAALQHARAACVLIGLTAVFLSFVYDADPRLESVRLRALERLRVMAIPRHFRGAGGVVSRSLGPFS